MVMKIYWNQKGSCRGDSFAHKGSFLVDDVKKVVRMRNKDEGEYIETLLDEMYKDDYNIQSILFDCIHTELKAFRKILKSGKGYICLEESLIGFGLTPTDAKLGILDAIDNGDWVI
jgi:hypothetical protein